MKRENSEKSDISECPNIVIVRLWGGELSLWSEISPWKEVVSQWHSLFCCLNSGFSSLKSLTKVNVFLYMVILTSKRGYTSVLKKKKALLAYIREAATTDDARHFHEGAFFYWWIAQLAVNLMELLCCEVNKHKVLAFPLKCSICTSSYKRYLSSRGNSDSQEKENTQKKLMLYLSAAGGGAVIFSKLQSCRRRLWSDQHVAENMADKLLRLTLDQWLEPLSKWNG